MRLAAFSLIAVAVPAVLCTGGCHLINDLDGYDFVPGAGGGGGAGGAGATFAISFRVEQLSTELSVALNGQESLSADADGSYTFETELASGAAYELTWTDPVGERCASDAASGTIEDADVEVTITCTPTVRPLYPDAPNWLDYVDAAGDGPCDATSATRYADCIHGGERRAVYVLGAASCADVSGGDDALGAFSWSCDESGAQVQLVSTGLAQESGLTTLVDFTAAAFLPNHVTITTPSGTQTTPDDVWWGNPFAVFTGSVALDEPGTIYLVNDDPQARLTIEGARVAVVVAPDATVTAPAAPALEATAVDFIWVEGDLARGADLSDTGVSVLRNMRFAGDAELSDNHAMLVHGIEVFDGVNCIEATGNVGLAIELAGIDSCDRPVLMSGNTGGYIRELTAANCNSALGISGALGFAADRLTLAGFAMAALNVQNSTNVHIARLIVASTEEDGVRFDCNDCSINGATAVSVVDQGFNLSGTGMWLENLLAVNDGQGINAENLTTTGRNWISVSNNNAAEAIDLRVVNSATILGGVVKLGGSDTDCSVATSTGIDIDCEPANGSMFVHSIAAGGTMFAGKLTTNDQDNASDAAGAASFAADLDWVHFAMNTRVWGVDGTAFTNIDAQGACSATNTSCRIWDWALRSNNTVARNQNDPPTGDDTAVVAGQTFLINAVEVLGDGVGDDDALCESGEQCGFTPNVGGYQGHGGLTEIPDFENGVVTGVRLFRFGQNGR